MLSWLQWRNTLALNTLKICPLVSIVRAFFGLYPKDEISWPKISKDLRIALQTLCAGWTGIWCQAMLKWLTLAEMDARCENVCEVPHGGEGWLLAAHSGCQWPSLHFLKNHEKRTFHLYLVWEHAKWLHYVSESFLGGSARFLGCLLPNPCPPNLQLSVIHQFSHLAICSFFCMVMK